MGIEYLPRKKQDHLGVLLQSAADNVRPLRLDEAEYTDRCDEFFHVLTSALKQGGDKSPHKEAKEKNEWLRTLRVELSNLLGDLPRRE